MDYIICYGNEFIHWWREIFDKPDAYVALFTALLFVSTCALWWSTRRLVRITSQTVTLAREEFTATHRPKIIIHVAEFKHIPNNYPDETENRAGASILCFNVGESTAKNVEVRGEIFQGGGFSVDVQRPVVKEIAEVQSGQKLRVEFKSDWPATAIAAGPRQDRSFYLVGWIAYWDGNELRRETGFCFRAQFDSAHGDRWVSAGKPEYEYAY
jgi:hypothetical protein